MKRDSETGNDKTWHRHYRSNLGRWMTPDPVAGDITNPQSLNRYAYVLNNPLNLIDPLGLTCVQTDDGFTADNMDGKGCADVSGDSPGQVTVTDSAPPVGTVSVDTGGLGGGGGGANPDNPGGNPPTPGSTDQPPYDRTDVVIKVTSVATLAGEGLAAAICAGSGICEAIVAGALVGAAVGYTAAKVESYIRQASAEQKYLDYVARKYCVDRNALREAIHREKKGRQRGENLTEEEIEEIARRLPPKPGCVPQG